MGALAMGVMADILKLDAAKHIPLFREGKVSRGIDKAADEQIGFAAPRPGRPSRRAGADVFVKSNRFTVMKIAGDDGQGKPGAEEEREVSAEGQFRIGSHAPAENIGIERPRARDRSR